MKNRKAASLAGMLLCANLYGAQQQHEQHAHHKHGDLRAPVGVMGEHNHARGDLMLSYRFSHMEMKGNRDGGSDIPASAIANSASNRFAPPATLRVVPINMSMQMHMLGAMYALDQNWTLMAMANYMEKDMEHLTFQGMSGATVLGSFRSRSRGLGDTELTVNRVIAQQSDARLLLNFGVSLPTGKTDAEYTVLAPTGARPVLRLPYPMQLGSGTYDVIAGLSYADQREQWNWGSQWRSVHRTGDNDDGYSLGDEHRLQGWLSYAKNHRLDFSTRIAYSHRENIDGMDTRISAPVQTADPYRQAYKRLDLALGTSTLLDGGRHRLGIEFIVPVYQHLDGPQLKSDWQLQVGWQLLPW